MGSFQRMTPTQVGEAAIVAIRRYPFTSGFDGQGSKERVGHKVSFDSVFAAQICEDIMGIIRMVERRALLYDLKSII